MEAENRAYQELILFFFVMNMMSPPRLKRGVCMYVGVPCRVGFCFVRRDMCSWFHAELKEINTRLCRGKEWLGIEGRTPPSLICRVRLRSRDSVCQRSVLQVYINPLNLASSHPLFYSTLFLSIGVRV